jgi:uncharacterized membrane protein
MKNIVIWIVEILLAFIASATVVFAFERGYANRWRKKSRQIRIGLAPRIVGALIIMVVNLLLAVSATKVTVLAVIIMMLVTVLWGAAELAMYPWEVNLCGSALMAVASHLIAVAMYAFGGEMGMWPGWLYFCLLAELLLMLVLLLISVLYGQMQRHADEYHEEQNQRKTEAAAKAKKKKAKQRLDDEVDEELYEEGADKAQVVLTSLIVILLVAATLLLAWKMELLPFM